jgi:hypothetical protein
MALQADYQHVFALASGARVVPSLSGQYSSSHWTAVDCNPLQKQKSFVMWDAVVTFSTADNKWSVALYDHNIAKDRRDARQLQLLRARDSRRGLPPRV